MRDIRIRQVLNLLPDNEGEISEKRGEYFPVFSIWPDNTKYYARQQSGRFISMFVAK